MYVIIQGPSGSFDKINQMIKLTDYFYYHIRQLICCITYSVCKLIIFYILFLRIFSNKANYPQKCQRDTSKTLTSFYV